MGALSGSRTKGRGEETKGRGEERKAKEVS
jgi:hypothetical protein